MRDMRYGYFDEAKKEYVITRPDTPAPFQITQEDTVLQNPEQMEES